MPRIARRRRASAAALLSILLAAPGLAVAAPETLAPAGAAQASLIGTVRTAGGAPLAGARITAIGPVTAIATSGADGSFALGIPPGVYQITVTHGGFQPTSLGDVAVTPGAAQPLAVTLGEENLSSLRTIGHTATSARGTGGTINLGSAASTYVTAQTFANLAAPQINDVIDRIPDVTVQHMGSQQDTSIVVGGLQPYETQVLIDGHPIALGQYGVWLSHLFPSYLIGGFETQSGPGNTTPFANIAVGGTANILTPGYTTRPTAEFTTGIDSFASQYSSLITTGSAGPLQYVVALGTGGVNGPYDKHSECAVAEDYATAANSPGSSGIVQFCGDMSGSLYTRGSLLKLRYNFTPATSFELSALGSFGGYSPQGSAWGNVLGPTQIEQCMVADPLQCTNPANMNMVGRTIQGYSWYPGTEISNTQQIWSGQFRTSLGSNTLLIRPYVGSIQPESYDGTDEGYYPSFWSPPGTTADPVATSTFETSECPPGSIYSYNTLDSPQGTVVSRNGQIECFQYPYTFYEQDKLYGTTFSLTHPFGENSLTFTYDFHGQSTFAYANAPTNVTVPLSSNRFSTFALTGNIVPARNLNLDFGLYDTIWTLTGEQAEVDSAGNPVLDADGNVVTTGLFRKVSRFDPHLALVLRPDRNDSYRASWGTSETFPFIGDVSGAPAFQPYAQSAPLYTLGIFTEKSPNLQPETSSAFGLGADHRFGNNAVLSADLNYTTVRNVFQQLTLAENTTFQGQTGVLGIFTPINVALMRALVVQVKYDYTPQRGLGYGVAAAADRSILSGIPSAAYNDSPGFPVNDVQVCGNGLFTPGLATCIPYLKAYGRVDYTWHDGTYLKLGVDYEGKNNAYYQPPFAQLDLTWRHPLSRLADVQVSVENLLNSNAFSDLPEPNAGVPIVAETSSGQTTYDSTLLPLPPRTFRVQLRLHTGR